MLEESACQRKGGTRKDLGQGKEILRTYSRRNFLVDVITI